MSAIRPRREFLKSLLALPLVGAPPVAAGLVTEYDLSVFPVAGFAFYDGPELLGRLRPGDELGLVPEPDNRHDPRAIRIEATGHKIGYVPRSENGPLFRLLAQGARLHARVLAVRAQAATWDAVKVAVSIRPAWVA